MTTVFTAAENTASQNHFCRVKKQIAIDLEKFQDDRDSSQIPLADNGSGMSEKVTQQLDEVS